MKDREQNGQKFEDNKRFNQRHILKIPKENTKEIIRRHKSMKDREHNGQKFEDTKDTKGNQKTQINEGQRTQWPKV